MMNDEYIMGRLYVPLIMIIILMVMIYFNRNRVNKYLYITNIFCFVAAILCYFVYLNNIEREVLSKPWMNPTPFIWLGGIFGGYFLSIASVITFIIDYSHRHNCTKILIRIVGLIFAVLCIIGVYLLIQGISSLKSG